VRFPAQAGSAKRQGAKDRDPDRNIRDCGAGIDRWLSLEPLLNQDTQQCACQSSRINQDLWDKIRGKWGLKKALVFFDNFIAFLRLHLALKIAFGSGRPSLRGSHPDGPDLLWGKG